MQPGYIVENFLAFCSEYKDSQRYPTDVAEFLHEHIKEATHRLSQISNISEIESVFKVFVESFFQFVCSYV